MASGCRGRHARLAAVFGGELAVPVLGTKARRTGTIISHAPGTGPEHQGMRTGRAKDGETAEDGCRAGKTSSDAALTGSPGEQFRQDAGREAFHRCTAEVTVRGRKPQWPREVACCRHGQTAGAGWR